MGEKTMRQKLILGIQHTLAMFGATVLVPALTGLNTSITLFCAGLGTLLFHWITKKKVPVFLGSSFAFMAGGHYRRLQDGGSGFYGQAGFCKGVTDYRRPGLCIVRRPDQDFRI